MPDDRAVAALLATRAQPTLFRQVALDRISSPEQLDRRMVVTPTRLWLGLLMLIVMVVAGVGWACLGRIATYVTANGLLMHEGSRIYSVIAPGNGTLVDMVVEVDDVVTKGEIIAHVRSRDIDQQLVSARDTISQREAELQRQRDARDTELAAKRAGFEERRQALEAQQARAQSRADALRAKLADEERLLRDQVVTRSTVLQSRAALNQALQEAADAATQITQLGTQDIDVTYQADQRVKNAEYALADARNRLAELTKTSAVTTEVIAPASGTVTEVAGNPGSLVSRGQTLLAIETASQRVELLLFLSHRDGDRIKARNRVQVSPSWTQREEEGTILGTVAEVSRFPLSPEALRGILHNEDLVRRFSSNGPPIMARVRLDLDPRTVSGYAWTSSSGARVAVSAGGSATADVLVRERRPIELAIPALRRWSGI